MIVIIVLAVLMAIPNMSWALSIEEHVLGRRDFPPFATTDSAVKMDVTFTSLAVAQAAGFVEEGTGITYSASGFNGHGTGNLYAASWTGYASVGAQGTVYIQVERSALAFANAENGLATYFSDSTGLHNSSTKRFLLDASNGAQTDRHQIYHQDGGAPAYFVHKYIVNSVTQEQNYAYLNSHAVPTYQNSTMAELVLTWRDKQWYLYIDGSLYTSGVSAASPASAGWQYLRLGDITSNGWVLGNYNVKRIQISTYFSLPVMSPLRVAGYGDSFTRNSGGGAVPGADTIVGIDAVQVTRSITAPMIGSNMKDGQTGFVHGLRALAWQELGFTFPYYVAGKGGAGWSHEAGTPPSAYANAVNAWAPELVITMMSVNDVLPSTPVTTLVADAKTVLDTLIDGNSSLRTILFFTGVSGHQNPTTASITGYLTEYKRVLGLLNAGLDGYRDKVKIVDVYTCWGGDSYPTTQTTGSAPDNVVTQGNDIHPSPTGMTVIASCMWPEVKKFLIQRPKRP